MPQEPIDLTEIRRIAIAALFSDDVLTEYLVLKGGNALNLVYGITSRTSIDLDFAMGQDFGLGGHPKPAIEGHFKTGQR